MGGSRENGVCLPGNQPVTLGESGAERGDMQERGREQGNSGLKTVKFKLKGQDTIQVLFPLSFTSSFPLFVPFPRFFPWEGCGVMFGGRAPVGRERGKS